MLVQLLEISCQFARDGYYRNMLRLGFGGYSGYRFAEQRLGVDSAFAGKDQRCPFKMLGQFNRFADNFYPW